MRGAGHHQRPISFASRKRCPASSSDIVKSETRPPGAGATKAALDHHARSVAADGNPPLRICSISPGIIDTGMQAEIRSTSPRDFPLLDRFLAFKQKGELAMPRDATKQLVRYLLSDHFGKDAVADLRKLPADCFGPDVRQ